MVRVEVVLAVKLAGDRGFAAEHEAGEGGEAEGLFVHDGERTGEAEADGADVRIGLGAVLDRAGAEHLGAGLELNVNLEADGGDVVGHGKNGLLLLRGGSGEGAGEGEGFSSAKFMAARR